MHSPERHGSNFEINGTHFTYGYLCGLDKQKVFAIKKRFERIEKELCCHQEVHDVLFCSSQMFPYVSFFHL